MATYSQRTGSGWMAKALKHKKPMNPHKDIIIAALQQYKGDDYERAKRAFASCSTQVMEAKYGESGITRREILDGYKAHADKCDAAIAWAETL